MNIVGRRRLWYTISLSVLLPSVVALAVFGLNLGIDFTGGAVLHVSGDVSRADVEQFTAETGHEEAIVTSAGMGSFMISTASQEAAELENAANQYGLHVDQFEQVGPSVSQDLVKNAVGALVAVSLAIVMFVGYAFRRVPNPFRYGSLAIVALLHDALLVLGVFAVLGYFLGVEVNTFFVTAILTVIGFSVHDTIVVFDRIRENTQASMADFSAVVNSSINEVMVRSLNTSITTIVVLLALLLFGGASIRYFVLALLVGMVSGAYSSIFIASPLLVSWHRSNATRPNSSNQS